MAVKILIKRKVPSGRQDQLHALLGQLRMLTIKQPGYISGETLNRIDGPAESLVISTWQSIEEWRKWISSDDRKEIQNKIDRLLGKETTYEIYEN